MNPSSLWHARASITSCCDLCTNEAGFMRVSCGGGGETPQRTHELIGESRRTQMVDSKHWRCSLMHSMLYYSVSIFSVAQVHNEHLVHISMICIIIFSCILNKTPRRNENFEHAPIETPFNSRLYTVCFKRPLLFNATAI